MQTSVYLTSQFIPVHYLCEVLSCLAQISDDSYDTNEFDSSCDDLDDKEMETKDNKKETKADKVKYLDAYNLMTFQLSL